MYLAQATTDGNGYIRTISTTIGTGGHGDTTAAYTETFVKELSMVSEQERFNTGKKTNKGKIVYYIRLNKVPRASFIEDIQEIAPLIVKEFLSVGLKLTDSIKCFDLLKPSENSEGDYCEIKKGLSFACGDCEARLLSGKHVFLYKSKIVRTLKGKN